jgi:thiol:disulfide interchange protein/DsbC/DsbD-like thiol-disulfide interchange protein
MRRLTLFLVLLITVPASIAPLSAAPVQRPHIEAELIPEKSGLRAGEPVTVALRLKMEKGWHTYWKNPGDSGLPTRITWMLPQGFSAGPIQWPVPQRIDVGPLTNFGYEGEIFLLTDIQVPAGLAAGSTVPITARADWLVCEEICIPGDATFTFMLPLINEPATADPKWAKAIERTRQQLPRRLEGWNLDAYLRGDDLVLRLSSAQARAARIHNLTLFPDEDGWIGNASPQRMIRTAGGYELRVASAAAIRSKSGPLAGLIVAEPRLAQGVAAAVVEVPVESTAALADEILQQPALSPFADVGLLAALGLAFLGGVILNLMPCVFPVVSIKVLRFVEQARGKPTRLRKHGLVFAAGVLVSFWVVAGILLVSRAQGEALGWGYQLQSPPVVAGLALLFFVLALNLSGLFEVGTSLQSLAANLRLRNDYADSALSGMVATLVATPCTAPFMGAALGFALTRPAIEAMLVFSALALGMSSPYLLLCFWPALIRRIPRSGRWMETLKQVLAFPLFLTVVWLSWVLGKQAGVDAVARLLAGLTLVAAALWMVGRWHASTETGKRAATIVALVLAVAGCVLAWPNNRTTEAVAEEVSGPWKRWSPDALASARAKGRAVFVDFTAAWCVTCQVNKRLVLESDTVRARFEERNVVRLRADWTNQDAQITAALRDLGRIGVPVYAVYAAGSMGAPTLLPELLTQERVLRAIDEAAPTS